jgi:hypothetical protein
MHKGEEPLKPPKLSSQNDETMREIIEEIVKTSKPNRLRQFLAKMDGADLKIGLLSQVRWPRALG